MWNANIVMHYTLIVKSLVNRLAIIQSLASAAWRDWYNFLFFQNGLQPFGTYSKITTFVSTFDNTIAHLHLPLWVLRLIVTLYKALALQPFASMVLSTISWAVLCQQKDEIHLMHSYTSMILRWLPIIASEGIHSYNVQSCKSCMTCLPITTHMLKYISKLIKSCGRSQPSNILMFVYNCISTLGQMVDDIIYLQQMKLPQSFLEMVQKQLMSIMKSCSACRMAVYKGSVTFIIPIQLYIMFCCFLKERRDGTSTSLFNRYIPPGQNLSPKFYTMLIVSTLDLHKSNQPISFVVEGSFNNMFVMLGLLWNKASLLGSSITKRKFDLNSMVDCKIISLKTLILISAILGAVLFYHHRIPEAHVICSSCCKTHLQSVVTVKSQICF